MEKSLPAWLMNWLTIENNPDLFLDVEEAEVGQLKIQVIWQGLTCEMSDFNLKMTIHDEVQCIWKPHLCPNDNMIIGDLLFRAPGIVLQRNQQQLLIIPDIDFLEKSRETPQYFDYILQNHQLVYGLNHYQKQEHVYHIKSQEIFKIVKGQVLFSFYICEELSSKKRSLLPLKNRLWKLFAEERYRENVACFNFEDLRPYVDYTYQWAFNKWESVVWQEFDLNNQQVGAPVFIVRAGQKPGLGEEDIWREPKSIWNQAWFSSLRSAFGYYLYGKQTESEVLKNRAIKAKNLAMQAPLLNGLFPSVLNADAENTWNQAWWGHSNRRPDHHEEYGHIVDMSWTAYWLLKWYQNHQQDDEIMSYILSHADRLIEIQENDGNIPAWIHMETGEISEYLRDSPETAMPAWFLLELYLQTKEEKYYRAAEKSIDFLTKEILPQGRWEDFETYWSCAREWDGKQLGIKDRRSGLYNQSTFSMYWTVEALMCMYLASGNSDYLELGELVLAELSLYQAVWNPPYVNVPVIGGFGVLNSDDEWNDARQSLIAVTYYQYYLLTQNEEYYLRSLSAIKAAFHMMYCPENPIVTKLYDKTFPFMNSDDYGFEMENAHHGSNIDVAGEFTIFDWGNGSASASYAILAELMKRKA